MLFRTRMALNSCDIPRDGEKKLARGISRATDNVNLVYKAREEFANDIVDVEEDQKCLVYVETPVYTFVLPDLSSYSGDFRMFLEKDLIELSTLVSLEQAGRLNWWAEENVCQRLWPLATTGDGNCLLHAASLGMWGFHDRLLTLRKALYVFLTKSDACEALWRRWRWQQSQTNAESGLLYSEEEWRKEWENILKLASTEPRVKGDNVKNPISHKGLSSSESDNSNDVYESLEEIHVLALAHILRRPVIVVADTVLKDVSGEPLAPIPFGGIYLPLECSPSKCHRSPLVLAYDAAHFSALVVMEDKSVGEEIPAVIPITDSDHTELPIQFLIDPGENYDWLGEEHSVAPSPLRSFTMSSEDKLELVGEYLDIVKVPLATPPDIIENSNPLGTLPDKPRGGKQISIVAKQFNSLGRNVTKKIRKNLENLGMKRTVSLRKKKGSDLQPVSNFASRKNDYILAAVLHVEQRHHYQEKMVQNYLSSAEARYRSKLGQGFQNCVGKSNCPLDLQLVETAVMEGSKQCINSGCTMFGTALTSYMCTDCYLHQKEREESQNFSRTAVDSTKLNGCPVERSSPIDQNLYLGKSTFYHDYPAPTQISRSLLNSYNLQQSASNPNSKAPKTETDSVHSSASSIRSREETLRLGSSWHTKEMPLVSVNEDVPPFPKDVADSQPGNKFPLIKTCRTPSCNYYGSSKYEYYCSGCFSDKQKKFIDKYVNMECRL